MDFDKVAKDAKATAALPSYTTAGEVEMALSLRRVSYHTPVRFLAPTDGDRTWEMTTAGRVLFNAIVPPATRSSRTAR